LAREWKADLREDGRLYRDLPGQDRLRAWHTAKPLFDAVDALEEALTKLVAGNKRYERKYEELPKQRAAKELEHKRVKELKAAGSAQPLPGGAAPAQAEGGSFLDALEKGA
jgi:hypothetical protein